jgi:hypothetical protein
MTFSPFHKQDEEGSEEVNGKRGAASAPQVLFSRKSKMSEKDGPWCEALGSGQGPSFPPTLTFRDFSLFVARMWASMVNSDKTVSIGGH